ncbi:hypothetical protein HF325_003222 [Metschnikowia pulcherrima]|uniref:Uncharacterized protein n=1 Tax=Metschnikowia pulcherrima TaxID=27326 RepID=A0A8H7GTF5_9ASCO|nr:hypothetical protein HF325_003222 [Metschnikowia pulcherrima]
MYTQLPKQRARASYGLSREDLTPRLASANMDDFDFRAVAEKYSPHKYTAEQIPEIPVYNRETNKFRRFSRIVSVPEMSVQELAAPSQPASLGQFKKHEKAGIYRPKPVEKDGEKDYKHITRKIPELGVEPNEPKAAPLSPQGARRIHEWINRRSSPPPKNGDPKSRPSSETKRLEAFENPEFMLDTRRNVSEKHSSANPKQFPKFVPQYQPHFRTRSIKEPENMVLETTTPKSHERQDSTPVTATPATYASSRVSTFESHLSVKSYASSETELLSVECCEPDIFSYYEKAGGLRSQYEGSLFERPRADEDDLPPEPPKHERRIVSDMVLSTSRDAVPRNNIGEAKILHKPITSTHGDMVSPTQDKAISRARVNPATKAQIVMPSSSDNALSVKSENTETTFTLKPRAPSFISNAFFRCSGQTAHDFCLDFGADYNKSKFTIPVENQVRRPHRHNDQIFIRKAAIHLKESNTEAPTNGDRRSVSSGNRVFSGLKNGLGLLSGKSGHK